MMAHHTGEQQIVVGVSGSPASRAALRWAAREASARRAPLLAVHAWEPTRLLRAPYAPTAGDRAPGDDQDRAQQTLSAAIAGAIPADLHIEVRTAVVQGLPAAVLLQHCDQATTMLVLGHHPSRLRDPAAAGPVTRVCTARARCPVVSVPVEARAGRERRTTAEPGRRALASG